MTDFSIWVFLGVALAVAICDVCWTLYFIEAGNKNALMAAFWSAMIMANGSFVTVTYVANWRYTIAAVIGAAIGTFGAVKFKS